MQRWFRHVIGALVLLIVGLALPYGGAMAQDESFCDAALEAAGNGAGRYGGFAIVWAPQGGGPDNQVVLGTSEGDILAGNAGNDVLCGFEGDDILNGGTGNDLLVGGGGYNVLKGGSGNDTLIGMEGDDFRPGSGNDTITTATVTEEPPVDSRAANITFRSATGNLCYADVHLSGFSPNPSLRILSYVSHDAFGATEAYNGFVDVTIDSTGRGDVTVSSGQSTLTNGTYVQVRVDDFSSSWTMIICI